MSEKKNKQTIILLILNLFILFLNSTGFNVDILAGLLGQFLGSLALGTIITLIYFKLAKKEKNYSKMWRLSALIAFIDTLIIVIPSLKEAFLSGYQKGLK